MNIKAINHYERKQLYKHISIFAGIAIIFMIIVISSAIDTEIKLVRSMIGVSSILGLLYYSYLIGKIKKTVALSINDYNMKYNGVIIDYSSIKTIVFHYCHATKTRGGTKYQAMWTEHNYYRCLTLVLQDKDLILGYLFDDNRFNRNSDIYDLLDYKDLNVKEFNVHCEEYLNSDPYLYIMDEDDLKKLIVFLVKNKGFQIKGLRK